MRHLRRKREEGRMSDLLVVAAVLAAFAAALLYAYVCERL
jgi:hypothetical protein